MVSTSVLIVLSIVFTVILILVAAVLIRCCRHASNSGKIIGGFPNEKNYTKLSTGMLTDLGYDVDECILKKEQLFYINSKVSTSGVGALFETYLNNVFKDDTHERSGRTVLLSPLFVDECKLSCMNEDFEKLICTLRTNKQYMLDVVASGKNKKYKTKKTDIVLKNRVDKIMDMLIPKCAYLYNKTYACKDENIYCILNTLNTRFDLISYVEERVHTMFIKHTPKVNFVIDTDRFNAYIGNKYKISNELDLNFYEQNTYILTGMVELKVNQNNSNVIESMRKFVLRIPSLIAFMVNKFGYKIKNVSSYIDISYNNLLHNSYYYNILTDTMLQFEYNKLIWPNEEHGLRYRLNNKRGSIVMPSNDDFNAMLKTNIYIDCKEEDWISFYV